MNGCLSYKVHFLRENETLCCVGFKWNDTHEKCLRKYSNYSALFIFFLNLYTTTKFHLYIIQILIFSLKILTLLLACDMGHVGINCSSKCSFPWYGVNCKSNCNCSETDCDHVYGCVMSKEGLKFFLTIFNFELISHILILPI